MKKINMIDLLFIFFIILFLSIIIYKFCIFNTPTNEDAPPLKPATVVLKIEGIREFYAEQLIPEMELSCIDANLPFGKILSKRTEPSQSCITVETGEIVKTIHPEKVDVYLTVQVSGIQNKTVFLIDNNYGIFIDDVKRFSCNKVMFYASIKNISENKQ